MLLQRCKDLGVHGPFLQALELMYSEVMQRVCINGRMGEVFQTHVGTKQGSELSPLLFGMFMDVLHELISMELPGAGPIIGNIRVPDLDYADDLALIALHDPAMLQQLLNCLDIFCAMFGMTVNFDTIDKTCAVAFRARKKHNGPLPRLRFRDQVVPWQDQYKYLGAWFHAFKDMSKAMISLAEGGHRAMHALLGRCRETCLTQFAFKCRLFDTLVQPLMSYGAHIWGPEVVAPAIAALADPSSHTNDLSAYIPASKYKADHVHHTFLRIMTGVGNKCSLDVLLRDCNRKPILFHWVVLSARWFTRVADLPPGDLTHETLVADLQLIFQGCTICWSYHFLNIMTHMRIIHLSMWHPEHRTLAGGGRDLLSLAHRFRPDVVHTALSRLLCLRWNGLHENPRNPLVPRLGFQRCVHLAWVQPMPSSGSMHSVTPPHMNLCLPFQTLQCLARLRMGWHDLEIRVGKHRGVPRTRRFCPMCSQDMAPFRGTTEAHAYVVEDVAHFLLDCAAYRHIRLVFSDMFPSFPARTDDDCLTLQRLFGHANQVRFALCVFAMTEFRHKCLALQPGEAIADVVALQTSQLQKLSASADVTDAQVALLQLPLDLT